MFFPVGFLKPTRKIPIYLSVYIFSCRLVLGPTGIIYFPCQFLKKPSRKLFHWQGKTVSSSDRSTGNLKGPDTVDTMLENICESGIERTLKT